MAPVVQPPAKSNQIAKHKTEKPTTWKEQKLNNAKPITSLQSQVIPLVLRQRSYREVKNSSDENWKVKPAQTNMELQKRAAKKLEIKAKDNLRKHSYLNDFVNSILEINKRVIEDENIKARDKASFAVFSFNILTGFTSTCSHHVNLTAKNPSKMDQDPLQIIIKKSILDNYHHNICEANNIQPERF